MHTWKEIEEDSDFSIHNLPLGIFSTSRRSPRAGVALGKEIIDLGALSSIGLLDDIEVDDQVFFRDTLNEYIDLGKSVTNKIREALQNLLTDENSLLREHPSLFVQQSSALMHMPIKVGDYTDFYSSIEHATNVGKMFRDPANALLPNWRHMPIGYHGRASSIVVSGTDIHRPYGQLKPADGQPKFAPSRRLDFELEMGFVIGKENKLGDRISTAEAMDHIFGLVLFNDWSARDIQKWEYVPLGPFLGKNFASSISPWIVPVEALAPFTVAGPKQEPPVLDYLTFKGDRNFDIDLQVTLQPKEGIAEVISRSNFKWMYWNMSQQLAHHTANGCNVKTGDILASGTISGPQPSSYGSLLELSWAGAKPILLQDGTSRTFIEDYDTITMSGKAVKQNIRVGFGSVTGQIIPAIDPA